MVSDKSNNNALAALFNKTCVGLLTLFYNNPGKKFYLREIVRKVGMGIGTIQRELSGLVLANLIVREKQGKQVYYGVNTKSPVYNEVRGLIIKTFGQADIIKNILDHFGGSINYAFIYGSQANGTSTDDSDIDLMIVGEIDEMKFHKAISKAENDLNKAVNYSLLTLEEFSKRKKDKKGFIGRIISGKKNMLIGNDDEI